MDLPHKSVFKLYEGSNPLSYNVANGETLNKANLQLLENDQAVANAVTTLESNQTRVSQTLEKLGRNYTKDSKTLNRSYRVFIPKELPNATSKDYRFLTVDLDASVTSYKFVCEGTLHYIEKDISPIDFKFTVTVDGGTSNLKVVWGRVLIGSELIRVKAYKKDADTLELGLLYKADNSLACEFTITQLTTGITKLDTPINVHVLTLNNPTLFNTEVVFNNLNSPYLSTMPRLAPSDPSGVQSGNLHDRLRAQKIPFAAESSPARNIPNYKHAVHAHVIMQQSGQGQPNADAQSLLTYMGQDTWFGEFQISKISWDLTHVDADAQLQSRFAYFIPKPDSDCYFTYAAFIKPIDLLGEAPQGGYLNGVDWNNKTWQLCGTHLQSSLTFIKPNDTQSRPNIPQSATQNRCSFLIALPAIADRFVNLENPKNWNVLPL